jgi:hypothetical protein
VGCRDGLDAVVKRKNPIITPARNRTRTLRSRGKVKVKLFLCLTKHHAMKTYWGSGDVTPRILDFGTRWRMCGQFHALAALPPGKEPSVPVG